MYKRLSEVSSDLNRLREKGFERGYSVGWNWEQLPYTIKLGSTTYMASAPASGKTELINEMQINLSCLHGLNHAIFTPETGTPAEVYAELCYKFLGKPYIKGFNEMSDTEKAFAEMFIDEHFFIVDPGDEDMTVDQFFKIVDQIEKETGKIIHTTLVDPWNELSENYKPEDLGREDKFLSRTLGQVRKNARAKNRHHFIVTHVRDQVGINQSGIVFYPMPTARDFSGGQVWFRKGNSILIPWRPPYGLSDRDNNVYAENELHLKIAKSKPKGISKNTTVKMYLDTNLYQYYLIDEWSGERVYADRGKYTIEKKKDLQVPKPLPVNRNFYEPEKEIEFNNDENPDLPF